jgi:hypothetical protein
MKTGVGAVVKALAFPKALYVLCYINHIQSGTHAWARNSFIVNKLYSTKIPFITANLIRRIIAEQFGMQLKFAYIVKFSKE